MKLICGPMATISHPAFRILVEKFGGCDEYFTEMINAGTLLTNGPFEKFYLNSAPVPEKIVWQLTGRLGEHMVNAAEVLVKLPGIGLDLNMGCSAPDIYRYGAGIAWMLKDISETRDMVKGVAGVVSEYNKNVSSENKKRLSVKLRLGDEDFTDEGFFLFCDMLVDCGVNLLTLHPRTKKEKLARPPRYRYCQTLKERYKGSGVSVYLNGNVRDENSYKNALIACPDVDGVMISRAAVQKPWIFRQLKACGQQETLQKNDADELQNINLKELAISYIHDIEIYQPPEFWHTRLQRFFAYFCDNFQFAHYAQTQFLNAKNNSDLLNRIDDFFQKCPDARYIKI